MCDGWTRFIPWVPPDKRWKHLTMHLNVGIMEVMNDIHQFNNSAIYIMSAVK